MLLACRRAGVPLFHGSHVAAVVADEAGLLATVSGERPQTIAADVVCLGYGFMPSNELTRAMGASHRPAPDGRSLEPVRADDGATSIEVLFVAGDCTRIGGARIALADGTLAGLAAARYAGRQPGEAETRLRREALAALSRHRRFQAALWSLYRTTVEQPPSDAGTILCRCEEVTLGMVQAALAEGLETAGQIKRRTRLGMGRCQGRYCGPALETLLDSRGPRTRDEFSGFAPRVPARPIRIADLARTLEEK
jgi:D-hydroxyproline dehydrogenase subunit alpha